MIMVLLFYAVFSRAHSDSSCYVLSVIVDAVCFDNLIYSPLQLVITINSGAITESYTQQLITETI
jgi:hypothetical protein